MEDKGRERKMEKRKKRKKTIDKAKGWLKNKFVDEDSVFTK